MLGRRELELLPDGAALLVMSRAAVVDLDALVELAAAGRLRAAVDVWPREPVPADHPARSVEGLLLSPHRTGGMPEAFQAIGRLVVADLELVLRGLPPVACRRAERETVGAAAQPSHRRAGVSYAARRAPAACRSPSARR